MKDMLRAAWCHLRGHKSRETLYITEERPSGVLVDRIVCTCLQCGRKIKPA